MSKMKKLTNKQKIILLTILSGVFGAIVFILIYGVQVLDVTKDGWLYAADDLTQQHIGWIFFRKAEWTFPIGEFNSLSYPNYASIIYTDSIPLLAIFFKVISGILPETFQYIGIYGLLCYILQGVFAFTLLRRYINNKLYCIIGSIFFIISPYLLQRMFWHTALSSHFLILAGLCLVAYRECYYEKPIKKIVLWNLLLAISVCIHLYFVPMILIMMFCCFLAEFIENKKTYTSSAISFVVSLILIISIIYVLGGMTSTKLATGGIRNYNINLNTFINPQGYSSILPDLHTATEGEYEAIGYLGAGIILMLIISITLVIKQQKAKEKIEVLKNNNIWPFVLCFFLGFILSLGASIKIGGNVVFNIEYPSFILYVLGLIRAIGRFIWLPCYIIYMLIIWYVSKYKSDKISFAIIIICLIIQIYDFYPKMTNKFEYQNKEYTISKQWEQVLSEKKHVVYLNFEEQTFDEMRTDYYKIANMAFKKDCTLNIFYFAREIKNTLESSQKYMEELVKGTVPKDHLFILNRKKEDKWWSQDLQTEKIDGFTVITVAK